MTAAEIARALGGRRNGKGWRARCPAHVDKTPSLDIDETQDGKVLLICRAGCPQDAVISALKTRGLWPEASPPTRSTPPREERDSCSDLRFGRLGEPTCRFDYHDASGNLTGTICRWDVPDGKEIRPATRRGDGWSWAAFPSPRPLYRLPDLATHRTSPVLVVEGEKTADAAREIVNGCVVTTWPGGSAAVSKADWSPLKGRDVTLWPDSDEAGVKAMTEVAQAAEKAGARSVRIVSLPDALPRGWDLADVPPDGMDIEALISDARDVRAERVAGLKLVNAAELVSRDMKPPIWAVPDIVPEGLAILAGKPKAGKSWLSLDFAVAAAGGTAALGNIACESGDVLLLALEDTERRLHGRLRAVLQGAQAPQRLTIATEWRRADDGGLDDLRAWLATHPAARLILIDTLQKIRGERRRDAGVYEDDYRAVAELKKIADDFTVPIVVLHHLNKIGNADPLMAVSGTAGITGAADTIIVLQREPNDPHAMLYVRGRDANEAELALQFDDETGKWLNLGSGREFRMSEERRAVINLLRDTREAMSPAEIAEALGRKRGAVRMLLSRMSQAGEINKFKTGKYWHAG